MSHSPTKRPLAFAARLSSANKAAEDYIPPPPGEETSGLPRVDASKPVARRPRGPGAAGPAGNTLSVPDGADPSSAGRASDSGVEGYLASDNDDTGNEKSTISPRQRTSNVPQPSKQYSSVPSNPKLPPLTLPGQVPAPLPSNGNKPLPSSAADTPGGPPNPLDVGKTLPALAGEGGAAAAGSIDYPPPPPLNDGNSSSMDLKATSSIILPPPLPRARLTRVLNRNLPEDTASGLVPFTAANPIREPPIVIQQNKASKRQLISMWLLILLGIVALGVLYYGVWTFFLLGIQGKSIVIDKNLTISGTVQATTVQATTAVSAPQVTATSINVQSSQGQPALINLAQGNSDVIQMGNAGSSTSSPTFVVQTTSFPNVFEILFGSASSNGTTSSVLSSGTALVAGSAAVGQSRPTMSAGAADYAPGSSSVSARTSSGSLPATLNFRGSTMSLADGSINFFTDNRTIQTDSSLSFQVPQGHSLHVGTSSVTTVGSDWQVGTGAGTSLTMGQHMNITLSPMGNFSLTSSTSNTTSLFMAADGKVGFGTNSPQATVHIAGSLVVEGLVLAGSYEGGNSGSGGGGGVPLSGFTNLTLQTLYVTQRMSSPVIAGDAYFSSQLQIAAPVGGDVVVNLTQVNDIAGPGSFQILGLMTATPNIGMVDISGHLSAYSLSVTNGSVYANASGFEVSVPSNFSGAVTVSGLLTAAGGLAIDSTFSVQQIESAVLMVPPGAAGLAVQAASGQNVSINIGGSSASFTVAGTVLTVEVASQQVGINTDMPQASLDVVGTARVSQTLAVVGNASASSFSTPGTVSASAGLLANSLTSSSGNVTISSTSGNDVLINIAGSAGSRGAFDVAQGLLTVRPDSQQVTAGGKPSTITATTAALVSAGGLSVSGSAFFNGGNVVVGSTGSLLMGSSFVANSSMLLIGAATRLDSNALTVGTVTSASSLSLSSASSNVVVSTGASGQFNVNSGMLIADSAANSVSVGSGASFSVAGTAVFSSQVNVSNVVSVGSAISLSPDGTVTITNSTTQGLYSSVAADRLSMYNPISGNSLSLSSASVVLTSSGAATSTVLTGGSLSTAMLSIGSNVSAPLYTSPSDLSIAAPSGSNVTVFVSGSNAAFIVSNGSSQQPQFLVYPDGSMFVAAGPSDAPDAFLSSVSGAVIRAGGSAVFDGAVVAKTAVQVLNSNTQLSPNLLSLVAGASSSAVNSSGLFVSTTGKALTIGADSLNATSGGSSVSLTTSSLHISASSNSMFASPTTVTLSSASSAAALTSSQVSVVSGGALAKMDSTGMYVGASAYLSGTNLTVATVLSPLVQSSSTVLVQSTGAGQHVQLVAPGGVTLGNSLSQAMLVVDGVANATNITSATVQVSGVASFASTANLGQGANVLGGAALSFLSTASPGSSPALRIDKSSIGFISAGAPVPTFLNATSLSTGSVYAMSLSSPLLYAQLLLPQTGGIGFRATGYANFSFENGAASPLFRLSGVTAMVGADIDYSWTGPSLSTLGLSVANDAVVDGTLFVKKALVLSNSTIMAVGVLPNRTEIGPGSLTVYTVAANETVQIADASIQISSDMYASASMLSSTTLTVSSEAAGASLSLSAVNGWSLHQDGGNSTVLVNSTTLSLTSTSSGTSSSLSSSLLTVSRVSSPSVDSYSGALSVGSASNVSIVPSGSTQMTVGLVNATVAALAGDASPLLAVYGNSSVYGDFRAYSGKFCASASGSCSMLLDSASLTIAGSSSTLSATAAALTVSNSSYSIAVARDAITLAASSNAYQASISAQIWSMFSSTGNVTFDTSKTVRRSGTYTSSVAASSVFLASNTDGSSTTITSNAVNLTDATGARSTLLVNALMLAANASATQLALSSALATFSNSKQNTSTAIAAGTLSLRDNNGSTVTLSTSTGLSVLEASTQNTATLSGTTLTVVKHTAPTGTDLQLISAAGRSINVSVADSFYVAATGGSPRLMRLYAQGMDIADPSVQQTPFSLNIYANTTVFQNLMPMKNVVMQSSGSLSIGTSFSANFDGIAVGNTTSVRSRAIVIGQTSLFAVNTTTPLLSSSYLQAQAGNGSMVIDPTLAAGNLVVMLGTNQSLVVDNDAFVVQRDVSSSTLRVFIGSNSTTSQNASVAIGEAATSLADSLGSGSTFGLLVSRDAKVMGNLEVDGAVAVASNVSVTGSLTVTGTSVSFTGAVLSLSKGLTVGGSNVSISPAGVLVTDGVVGSNNSVMLTPSALSFASGSYFVPSELNVPLLTSPILRTPTSSLTLASGSSLVLASNGTVVVNAGDVFRLDTVARTLSLSNSTVSIGNVSASVASVSALSVLGNVSVTGTVNVFASGDGTWLTLNNANRVVRLQSAAAATNYTEVDETALRVCNSATGTGSSACVSLTSFGLAMPSNGSRLDATSVTVSTVGSLGANLSFVAPGGYSFPTANFVVGPLNTFSVTPFTFVVGGSTRNVTSSFSGDMTLWSGNLKLVTGGISLVQNDSSIAIGPNSALKLTVANGLEVTSWDGLQKLAASSSSLTVSLSTAGSVPSIVNTSGIFADSFGGSNIVASVQSLLLSAPSSGGVITLRAGLGVVLDAPAVNLTSTSKLSIGSVARKPQGNSTVVSVAGNAYVEGSVSIYQSLTLQSDSSVLTLGNSSVVTMNTTGFAVGTTALLSAQAVTIGANVLSATQLTVPRIASLSGSNLAVVATAANLSLDASTLVDIAAGAVHIDKSASTVSFGSAYSVSVNGPLAMNSGNVTFSGATVMLQQSSSLLVYNTNSSGYTRSVSRMDGWSLAMNDLSGSQASVALDPVDGLVVTSNTTHSSLSSTTLVISQVSSADPSSMTLTLNGSTVAVVAAVGTTIGASTRITDTSVAVNGTFAVSGATSFANGNATFGSGVALNLDAASGLLTIGDSVALSKASLTVSNTSAGSGVAVTPSQLLVSSGASSALLTAGSLTVSSLVSTSLSSSGSSLTLAALNNSVPGFALTLSNTNATTGTSEFSVGSSFTYTFVNSSSTRTLRLSGPNAQFLLGGSSQTAMLSSQYSFGVLSGDVSLAGNLDMPFGAANVSVLRITGGAVSLNSSALVVGSAVLTSQYLSLAPNVYMSSVEVGTPRLYSKQNMTVDVQWMALAQNASLSVSTDLLLADSLNNAARVGRVGTTTAVVVEGVSVNIISADAVQISAPLVAVSTALNVASGALQVNSSGISVSSGAVSVGSYGIQVGASAAISPTTVTVAKVASPTTWLDLQSGTVSISTGAVRVGSTISSDLIANVTTIGNLMVSSTQTMVTGNPSSLTPLFVVNGSTYISGNLTVAGALNYSSLEQVVVSTQSFNGSGVLDATGLVIVNSTNKMSLDAFGMTFSLSGVSTAIYGTTYASVPRLNSVQTIASNGQLLVNASSGGLKIVADLAAVDLGNGQLVVNSTSWADPRIEASARLVVSATPSGFYSATGYRAIVDGNLYLSGNVSSNGTWFSMGSSNANIFLGSSAASSSQLTTANLTFAAAASGASTIGNQGLFLISYTSGMSSAMTSDFVTVAEVDTALVKSLGSLSISSSVQTDFVVGGISRLTVDTSAITAKENVNMNAGTALSISTILSNNYVSLAMSGLEVLSRDGFGVVTQSTLSSSTMAVNYIQTSNITSFATSPGSYITTAPSTLLLASYTSQIFLQPSKISLTAPNPVEVGVNGVVSGSTVLDVWGGASIRGSLLVSGGLNWANLSAAFTIGNVTLLPSQIVVSPETVIGGSMITVGTGSSLSNTTLATINVVVSRLAPSQTTGSVLSIDLKPTNSTLDVASSLLQVDGEADAVRINRGSLLVDVPSGGWSFAGSGVISLSSPLMNTLLVESTGSGGGVEHVLLSVSNTSIQLLPDVSASSLSSPMTVAIGNVSTMSGTTPMLAVAGNAVFMSNLTVQGSLGLVTMVMQDANYSTVVSKTGLVTSTALSSTSVAAGIITVASNGTAGSTLSGAAVTASTALVDAIVSRTTTPGTALRITSTNSLYLSSSNLSTAVVDFLAGAVQISTTSVLVPSPSTRVVLGSSSVGVVPASFATAQLAVLANSTSSTAVASNGDIVLAPFTNASGMPAVRLFSNASTTTVVSAAGLSAVDTVSGNATYLTPGSLIVLPGAVSLTASQGLVAPQSTVSQLFTAAVSSTGGMNLTLSAASNLTVISSALQVAGGSLSVSSSVVGVSPSSRLVVGSQSSAAFLSTSASTYSTWIDGSVRVGGPVMDLVGASINVTGSGTESLLLTASATVPSTSTRITASGALVSTSSGYVSLSSTLVQVMAAGGTSSTNITSSQLTTPHVTADLLDCASSASCAMTLQPKGSVIVAPSGATAMTFVPGTITASANMFFGGANTIQIGAVGSDLVIAKNSLTMIGLDSQSNLAETTVTLDSVSSQKIQSPLLVGSAPTPLASIAMATSSITAGILSASGGVTVTSLTATQSSLTMNSTLIVVGDTSHIVSGSTLLDVYGDTHLRSALIVAGNISVGSSLNIGIVAIGTAAVSVGPYVVLSQLGLAAGRSVVQDANISTPVLVAPVLSSLTNQISLLASTVSIANGAVSVSSTGGLVASVVNVTSGLFTVSNAPVVMSSSNVSLAGSSFSVSAVSAVANSSNTTSTTLLSVDPLSSTAWIGGNGLLIANASSLSNATVASYLSDSVLNVQGKSTFGGAVTFQSAVLFSASASATYTSSSQAATIDGNGLVVVGASSNSSLDSTSLVFRSGSFSTAVTPFSVSTSSLETSTITATSLAVNASSMTVSSFFTASASLFSVSPSSSVVLAAGSQSTATLTSAGGISLNSTSFLFVSSPLVQLSNATLISVDAPNSVLRMSTPSDTRKAELTLSSLTLSDSSVASNATVVLSTTGLSVGNATATASIMPALVSAPAFAAGASMMTPLVASPAGSWLTLQSAAGVSLTSSSVHIASNASLSLMTLSLQGRPSVTIDASGVVVLGNFSNSAALQTLGITAATMFMVDGRAAFGSSIDTMGTLTVQAVGQTTYCRMTNTVTSCGDTASPGNYGSLSDASLVVANAGGTATMTATQLTISGVVTTSIQGPLTQDLVVESSGVRNLYLRTPAQILMQAAGVTVATLVSSSISANVPFVTTAGFSVQTAAFTVLDTFISIYPSAGGAQDSLNLFANNVTARTAAGDWSLVRGDRIEVHSGSVSGWVSKMTPSYVTTYELGLNGNATTLTSDTLAVSTPNKFTVQLQQNYAFQLSSSNSAVGVFSSFSPSSSQIMSTQTVLGNATGLASSNATLVVSGDAYISGSLLASGGVSLNTNSSLTIGNVTIAPSSVSVTTGSVLSQTSLSISDANNASQRFTLVTADGLRIGAAPLFSADIPSSTIFMNPTLLVVGNLSSYAGSAQVVVQQEAYFGKNVSVGSGSTLNVETLSSSSSSVGRTVTVSAASGVQISNSSFAADGVFYASLLHDSLSLQMNTSGSTLSATWLKLSDSLSGASTVVSATGLVTSGSVTATGSLVASSIVSAATSLALSSVGNGSIQLNALQSNVSLQNGVLSVSNVSATVTGSMSVLGALTLSGGNALVSGSNVTVLGSSSALVVDSGLASGVVTTISAAGGWMEMIQRNTSLRMVLSPSLLSVDTVSTNTLTLLASGGSGSGTGPTVSLGAAANGISIYSNVTGTPSITYLSGSAVTVTDNATSNQAVVKSNSMTVTNGSFATTITAGYVASKIVQAPSATDSIAVQAGTSNGNVYANLYGTGAFYVMSADVNSARLTVDSTQTRVDSPTMNIYSTLNVNNNADVTGSLTLSGGSSIKVWQTGIPATYSTMGTAGITVYTTGANSVLSASGLNTPQIVSASITGSAASTPVTVNAYGGSGSVSASLTSSNTVVLATLGDVAVQGSLLVTNQTIVQAVGGATALSLTPNAITINNSTSTATTTIAAASMSVASGMMTVSSTAGVTLGKDSAGDYLSVQTQTYTNSTGGIQSLFVRVKVNGTWYKMVLYGD